MSNNQIAALRDRVALLKAGIATLGIALRKRKGSERTKSVKTNDGKPDEKTGWKPDDGKPEFMAYAKDGEGGGAAPAAAGGPDAGDVHVPGTEWSGKKPKKKAKTTDVVALKARASELMDRIDKAITRFPAGTPGGKGGQFAPANAGGGGGGIPARPDISRFRQDHPSVRRLHRRLDALQDMANRGDLDGIRAMTTSRGNSYDRTLDDHRTALLQHFEPAARAARLRDSMPQMVQLTGSNMQNSALLSAQRHIVRMHALAQSSPDPVAALRDYRIGGGGRTNTYLRQAQQYHAALLAHFSAGEARGTAPATAAAPRPVAAPPAPPVAAAPVAAPAAAQASAKPARTAANANFSHSALNGVRNTAANIGGREVTVADVSMTAHAANPRGMHPEDLGFIPRPNVPLTARVGRDGISVNGRLQAFSSPEQRLLAQAYLSQPSSLQSRARDYQNGTYQPPRPLTPEERAAQLAREKAQERAAQERIRAAAAAEEARRAAIPDAFRPKNAIGANVNAASVTVGRNSFKSTSFATKQNMETFAKRIIADYGGTAKFTITGNVSGNSATIGYTGSDGTRINRNFTANDDGSIDVYHAYFSAGSRGGGAGKRFFRVSMGEYIAAGVRHVDVTANIDVGGYAWARFGYLPKTQMVWDNLRTQLKTKLDGMLRRNEINGVQHQAAAAILNDTDKRSLWKLSDFESDGKKIGKNLLLGTHWSGRIDTKNAEQMRRFTQYVGDKDD